jgi:hypothetical protein
MQRKPQIEIILIIRDINIAVINGSGAIGGILESWRHARPVPKRSVDGDMFEIARGRVKNEKDQSQNALNPHTFSPCFHFGGTITFGKKSLLAQFDITINFGTNWGN